MPDLTCLDDLDSYMAENASPFDDYLQDCYHRLLEAPGSNPDDPNRGLGLDQMLSGTVDPQIKARIEGELKKDSRTQSVQVVIIPITLPTGAGYQINIRLQADGRTLGLVIQTDGTSFTRVN